MGNLATIAQIALAERERRQRAQSWQTDPVLWSEEYLGVKLWSQQANVLRSILENRNTAVAAGHGVGKLVSRETMLPTPDGWICAGDVVVGNTLFDEQGNPTRVTGLTEVWIDEDEYEIEFDDGTIIRAGGRHEWNVLDSSRAGGDWDATVIVETAQIARSGRRRWSIPLAAALNLPEANLPLSPYTLGRQITDPAGAAVGRIPNAYLRASQAQRQELLEGIIEGSGAGDVIELASEALSSDVLELVRSLGHKGRISGRAVRWSSDETHRAIVAARLVGKVSNFCIEVDSPRHLYLAGEGFVPTHNSFVAAIAMAWWVDVHPPTETFVASTAPFQDQITAILWNNLRGLYIRAAERHKKGLVDHPLPGYVTGDNKIKLENGLMLGQGRKPPDSKTDSGYQGLHAKYLLAIGDEAAGLSEDMISALGNITTGQDNRVLLIANPTDPNCAMAQIWKKDLSDWHRMHISVFDAPPITGEPGFPEEALGGMSGWDYVQGMKEKWGEEDAHYITRVLGQWAFEGGNNLFSEQDIAKAVNTVVVPDPTPNIHFGCDIARMGPDSTYVYSYVEGQVWDTDPETNKPLRPTEERGGQLRFVATWSKAPLVSKDPANLGSAERIHTAALAAGAQVVKIDAAGLGVGAIDGLSNISDGEYPIVGIYGSAPPTDKRAYTNIRAEQYFRMKQMMHAGKLDIDPGDEALLEELRGIVYEYSTNGQIKMESKDDMKRRGAKSPDRADAAWYACYDVDALLYGPQAGETVVHDTDIEEYAQSSSWYSMGSTFGW